MYYNTKQFHKIVEVFSKIEHKDSVLSSQVIECMFSYKQFYATGFEFLNESIENKVQLNQQIYEQALIIINKVLSDRLSVPHFNRQ